MKRQAYISAVVYVRNEEPTIERNLLELASYLAENFEMYELVVLEDGSSDNTFRCAQRVATTGRYNISIVSMARRHGVEATMQAGLERAAGDWMLELESSATDFQLALIGEMYDEAALGYDIVTAAGDRGVARSRLFYGVLNRYAELEQPLRTVRVRLASRRSVSAMLSMTERVRYRKALYAYNGAKQLHVGYRARPTAGSQRGGRRLDRETWSLAFDILLSFSGFGLRLAHRLSFTFGLLSLLGIAYALFVYLLRDDVVQGWTTVTVVASGGFAGVFLVLGILGEYAARILVEVRGRPNYAVRSADVVVRVGTGEAGPPPQFLLTQASVAADDRGQAREDDEMVIAPEPQEGVA